jgi:DNA-binding NarL/FixJ family response regulator
LTRRRADLAELVSQGLTDREIAERLDIQYQLVGGYRNAILKMRGLNDRQGLADWVRRRAVTGDDILDG